MVITNAQTQIQLPAGYGFVGTIGFVLNTAKPFYSHDGFLYCKAHLLINSTGFSTRGWCTTIVVNLAN